ncbi:hypothetical protein F070042J6_17340 [Bacteroides sp. f07]|jgi:hypothetical protein|uniref:hypothetical protein n=1 Tax=Bacteroides sp. f07 TaxID=3132704 RepID=UPI00280BF2CF|nr:hypothetical protein [uncultured Bacteroides sp.]
MDATIKNTKRKVIDIPDDIFRYLSIKAAAKGTNLKKYIEGLLVKDVESMIENMDDNEAYRLLSKNEPEGLTPASDVEQEEFRKWLGI